jgi:hypothetical protein
VTVLAEGAGSMITFSHTAIGPIPADGTTAHERGWATLIGRLCAAATDPPQRDGIALPPDHRD